MGSLRRSQFNSRRLRPIQGEKQLITRNGNPARNARHTTLKKEKGKRQKVKVRKAGAQKPTAEKAKVKLACPRHLTFAFYLLPFAFFSLLSCE
jgi:hypothetical protein